MIRTEERREGDFIVGANERRRAILAVSYTHLNGVFANNHFKSNAVTWDFLVLYADAQATVVFECVPYKQIQVATVLNLDRLIIKNAEIKNLDQNHILITPDNRTFTIEIQ